MLQDRLLAVAVVPLSMVGGILGISLRHMPLQRGAAASLCLLAGLGFAQGWIVVSGIVQARTSCYDVRRACSQGAKAKFKPVFLLGTCTAVGFLPMAVMDASAAQAQFATVIISGALFSTAGALIGLPALILWITG